LPAGAPGDERFAVQGLPISARQGGNRRRRPSGSHTS
jgi:hypothetical protein